MAMVSDVREIRGLMEISLDGVTWLRVRRKHFALLPLGRDESIDPEAYLDRLNALQANDCYEAALTMLDQAAQTSGDLKAKLQRKGFAPGAAQATVDRLVENRLVDDARYAERIAQSQKDRAVGAWAVRRKLMAKRLDEEIINAAMEDFDSQQQASACIQAAEKLWRKYSSLPSREGRAKLSQALARRGFSWDSIRSAVDKITDSGDFDDEF